MISLLQLIIRETNQGINWTTTERALGNSTKDICHRLTGYFTHSPETTIYFRRCLVQLTFEYMQQCILLCHFLSIDIFTPRLSISTGITIMCFKMLLSQNVYFILTYGHFFSIQIIDQILVPTQKFKQYRRMFMKLEKKMLSQALKEIKSWHDYYIQTHGIKTV